jgi:hypothetical protein
LIVDIEQRIAALEAEVARLTSRVFPPRAAPLPVESAIARVAITEKRHGTKRAFVFHRNRCVYLLTLRGLVVYVGRARTGYRNRYQDHDEKEHDSVTIFDLAVGTGVNAEKAFDSLECALIEHYQPRFNIDRLTSLLSTAALWPLHNAAAWARVTEAA